MRHAAGGVASRSQGWPIARADCGVGCLLLLLIWDGKTRRPHRRRSRGDPSNADDVILIVNEINQLFNHHHYHTLSLTRALSVVVCC